MNGRTVEDQRMSRYGCLSPTFHLAGRDVQLVRNKSRQTNDQGAQEVHVSVKKGVCADKQDDCETEGSASWFED